MIHQSTIETALRRFGFDKPKITPIKATNKEMQQSWFIDEEWILKASINKDQLIKNTRLLSVFGVSQRCSFDDTIICIDEWHFSCNKAIPGTPISSTYLLDQPSFAFKVGEAIARLHQSIRNINMEVPHKDMLQVVEKVLPNIAEYFQIPQSFCDNYLSQARLLLPKCNVQMIHRDMHPGNILIQDGDITGFIDFDLTESNIRIFDICYCLTAVLSECFDDDIQIGNSRWIAFYSHLIQGYHSINPLTVYEIQSLPLVLVAIELIFIAWLKGNLDYEALYDKNIEMMWWLIKHFDQIKETTIDKLKTV